MGNEGSITLQTQTWSRDSHGLFDYEHKKWEIDDIKLEEKCKIIYRSGSHVKLIEEHHDTRVCFFWTTFKESPHCSGLI